MNSINKRISLERQITRQVIQNNCIIYEISRGFRKSICSLSPAMANRTTSSEYGNGWKNIYSAFSNEIHSLEDERARIEKYINSIIPIYQINRFVHLAIQKVCAFENLSKLNEYIQFRGWKLVSKQNYYKLVKACNKWREASRKLHYQLTEKEKKTLKEKYEKMLKAREDAQNEIMALCEQYHENDYYIEERVRCLVRKHFEY